MRLKGMILGLLAVVALAACQDSSPLGVEHTQAIPERPVRIATWNLYVGGQLSDLLQVQDPTQIPLAVSNVLGDIEATDFASRAAAIADELASARPEVVSLQEVSVFHTQSPGDFLIGNPVAAATPGMNYLTILVDALAAPGFAEALAIRHGDEGINVSVVCPQAVATRMLDLAVGPGADENVFGGADLDGILSPEQVADCVVTGIAEDRFLIAPHPEVVGYFQNKAADYDRWIAGMRRLRKRLAEET